MYLLFHDLQDLHGACLDADAAGDALGSRIFGLHDHDLHGAGLNTLAATDALLLVDHVHTGLGVLGNGLMLTGTHALAALDANVGLGSVALGDDADAGQIFIKFLVERFGASLNALQTCHTLGIFLYSKLFHKKVIPFSIYTFESLYKISQKIAMGKNNIIYLKKTVDAFSSLNPVFPVIIPLNSKLWRE